MDKIKIINRIMTIDKLADKPIKNNIVIMDKTTDKIRIKNKITILNNLNLSVFYQ